MAKKFSANADDLIGFGENPNGVTSIVPNGVAREGVQQGHGEDWCHGSTDGPRWSCGEATPNGVPGTPGTPNEGSSIYVGRRPFRGNMTGF
jgi:hypothetical protein